MPDAAPDAPTLPTVPPWLEAATLLAMQEAVDRALAWDRTVILPH